MVISHGGAFRASLNREEEEEPKPEVEDGREAQYRPADIKQVLLP